ncbi:MAG: class I SAM-dependent methyltransferase [Hyphomicrobiaceae bacterium]|nr:MAG: class I SAM-dependent methyltransferase [Hyphomicrobiaceae bacterium]
MVQPVTRCRICGNDDLVEVLDLGEQALTGVFPARRDQKITAGPLRLVKCSGGKDVCGLLQLAHSYDLGEMYGDNYGYRSGLNASMVRHLASKVEAIRALVPLSAGDVVVDIGSNDGTTLGCYPEAGLELVGIDPTAAKFREFYKPHIRVIPDFFTADLFRQAMPGRKARVVTSFSMFYDLERPLDFMREVADILADDGVWVFEQSYMPLMIEMNSYDTACHEHLEYYALKQIKWMTDRCGLKIVDVGFNDVNGGSFSVAAAKIDSGLSEFKGLPSLLAKEVEQGLDTLEPYRAFARRTADSRAELVAFVRKAVQEGKRVGALGASTKGNVLLQFCAFTDADLFAIGEVNADKFGKFTPGTLIPIRPEGEVLASAPDYLIILPWHFRSTFIKKLAGGRSKIVFPLPKLEVVG